MTAHGETGGVHLTKSDLTSVALAPLTRSLVLKGMQAEVVANTKEKGWYDTDRSFGDDIALLHSEVSEMLEAYRDWNVDDATVPECHYKKEHSDDDSHLCKPRGVGSEASDVLIRLFDTCERYGIDLAAEYERKTAYNRTRPYRHGGRAL